MSSKELLILDGGFASQLVKDGNEIYDDPLWSSRLLHSNPDIIKITHKKFLYAGSDAVISSSYQASLDGFRKYLKCSDKEAKEVMKLSAILVKDACEEFWQDYQSQDVGEFRGRKKPWAVASLGPYGACLLDCSEYRGDYVETVSAEELRVWHKERLDLLAPLNLDLYLFETFPALEEVKAIVPLMDEYKNLKFAISFTCKDGQSLCHGESLREAVQFVESLTQAVAVGINCSSPQIVSAFLSQCACHWGGEDLLRSVEDVCKKNILVMANSGEEWTREKGWLANDNVKSLPEYVEEWRRLGANWIGGCCRVYTNDITEIRRRLTKPTE